MWETKVQTDSWINLGGDGLPDWVRVSTIKRVRTVAGATNATVTLSDGTQVATAYAAAAIMKIIGGESDDTIPTRN
jgi:hypothetical protein